MHNEEKSRDGSFDNGSFRETSRSMPSIEYVPQRRPPESQISNSFPNRPREPSVHNFSRPLTGQNATHSCRRHSFPATPSRSCKLHEDRPAAEERREHHEWSDSVASQQARSRSQHGEANWPGKRFRRRFSGEVNEFGDSKSTVGKTDRLDFVTNPDKSQRKRALPPRLLRVSRLESIAPDELSPRTVTPIPSIPSSALRNRSTPRERGTWNCLPCTTRKQRQPTSTGATNSSCEPEDKTAALHSLRDASTAGTEKSFSSVSDSKGRPSTISNTTEGVSSPGTEDFAKYSPAPQ